MAFLPSISSDPSPRASITFPDVTNPRDPRDPDAIMYEQSYDIKFSHVPARDVKTSMLAYTEHMRTLSKTRHEPTRASPDHLEVRAHHIPRYSPAKTGNSRRKVSTLNELTAKGEKSPVSMKKQVLEREERLSISPGQTQPVSKVRVSLVSASDLHDIVDLSMRMRGTKQDGVQVNRMEKELKLLEGFLPQGAMRRSPVLKGKANPLPPVPRVSPPPPAEETSPRKVPESQEDVLQESLPASSSGVIDVGGSGEMEGFLHRPEKLRKRPRRAKRMKLRKPDLGSIPEYDSPRHEAGMLGNGQYPASYPFVVVSPRSPIMFPTPESLSAIRGSHTLEPEGNVDSSLGTDKKGKRSSRRSTLLPPLDLQTSSDESEEDNVKSETKSIKLKAQKKFRKLIFLRDFPDKYYHRTY